ncbi:tol-pal system protein YbgF [Salipiger mangrovisoli]|uniref:Cell division coordinator CpoB n=1 Tax=Salipiger mangrovisoli TaxID=2865933 RepID=A0ABR9X163_9RHOB|nr:tol-pal system protein YbgF [Salipiger mangrovisoli]MBE9637302.1 tol-pal system protein YbgF [Salipiger mangrovisoli]
MRLTGIALCLGLIASGAQAQQTETLADLRQELSMLSGELQKLKQELNSTGIGAMNVPASTLDRVNAIEAELTRVTAKTEELGHRIDSVVADGTNRIGDLEFRICEIEPGCDIGNIGQTKPLGGQTPATSGPVTSAPAPSVPETTLPSNGAQLAVGEETDFRRAQEALANGDFQSAAEKFAAFRQAYPGSPLEAASYLAEGQALKKAGDTREAARRFLGAYANYPDSEVAPAALWQLGTALGELGSKTEACVTLGEVSTRYPGTEEVSKAAEEMGRLGCQ